MSTYESIRGCRSHVFAALSDAMRHRHLRKDTWVDDERLAVVIAANEWAQAHGFDRRVTVADVERIEVGALGHVDYASKLALYVAEFLVDPADWQVS